MKKINAIVNHECSNRLLFLFIPVLVYSCSAPVANTTESMKNKEIIHEAFQKWSEGTGNFFDLLRDDVVWTITGNCPVSKTYFSKKQFIDEVIDPLNSKLSKKITPVLKGLYSEGDMVIALWEGTALANDGKPYVNTYSWYMRMKEGRIVDVTAFFDTIAFTDVWLKQ